MAGAADAFVGYASVITMEAVPRGLVLDLGPLALQTATSLDDFYPTVLSLLQEEDGLWGLPFRAHLDLIYYDPARFDEAGLPHPGISWTWDDLAQAAADTAAVADEKVLRYGFIDLDPATTILLQAEQQAGPLLDEGTDPVEVYLDHPAVAEALVWYADLASVEGATAGLETDSATLQDLRYQGEPALWTGGSFEMGNFPEAAVAPYPGEDGPASNVSAWGYFVSAGTAHPEAAWHWIEFLSRQNLQGLQGQLPARRSVAEAAGFWEALEPERAEVLRHCLEEATSLSPTLVWAMREAEGALAEGRLVEAALAAGQAHARSQLGQAATMAQSPAPAVVVQTPTPSATGRTVVRFLAHPAVRAMRYDALAADFEKDHPDIDMRVDDGWRVSGIENKIAASDCFVGPPAAFLTRGTEGLLPLDPLIEESGFSLDAYYPNLLEQARVDGRIWGLPLDSDATLLRFNRDLFDAAGLAYSDATWTVDTFSERALALSDPDALEPTYGFQPLYPVSVFLIEDLMRLGARLTNEAGEPSLDGPSVTEAVARYAELVRRAMPAEVLDYENILGYVTTTTSAGQYPAEVAKGRVAMWSELYGQSIHAAPASFEVGVAPLPSGEALADLLPASMLYISADTHARDACWQWITFLSDKPLAVALLPARRDITEGKEWRRLAGEELATAWTETVSRSEGRLQAVSYGADVARYWLNEAFAEVVAGRDIRSALEDAQEKAMVVYTCLAKDDPNLNWQACALEADPQVRLVPAGE